MSIEGFYKAGLYSKPLVTLTFCSASRSQKNTLGVSDSEVQFQLQLLSSPQFKRCGFSHFIPVPQVTPPPHCDSSLIHLLFIVS